MQALAQALMTDMSDFKVAVLKMISTIDRLLRSCQSFDES